MVINTDLWLSRDYEDWMLQILVFSQSLVLCIHFVIGCGSAVKVKVCIGLPLASPTLKVYFALYISLYMLARLLMMLVVYLLRDVIA